MLLVVTYSRAARQALRNACGTHDETVVQRFGRAALLEPTEFGGFLALWLRAEHGPDVQVERTAPLVAERDVPGSVRAAVGDYAAREQASTAYATFAAGTDHPDPAAMKEREL